MGAYMLVAFIIGFWCIWSANRDVNSLLESLWLTLLAIVIRALMEWSGVPEFDTVTLAQWGVLFVFTVVIMELVNRYSRNMGINMSLALIGAFGWFFLARYIFSEEGRAWVSGFIA